MHPSIPTAINDITRIYSIEELNKLVEELGSMNLPTEIIYKHNQVRSLEGDSILSSNLRVTDILTLYMYIFLHDFD